ncbi:MAG: glutathionylspermidine synthase family protein [Deltaproteobacteria bacterium]|nr:glutathionylspermidine synthase family protein [Deltaproteobacteria bacterium]
MSAAAVAVEPLALKDPLAIRALSLELTQRWFVWDACTGGERRVDLHPLVLSEAAHREAASAAERAASLVSRMAERAARDAAERALYKLPPGVEALAAAARAGGDRGSFARVDLLLRADGKFVACEVNADCPGGHNETLALPRLARTAGFRRGYDPTTAATALADRLVELSGGKGSPRGIVGLVYATAYAEDLQVCALLERLVVERGGRAARMPATAPHASSRVPPAAAPHASSRVPPAAAPHADGDGIAIRGERVAVLYRFYPLEYMEGQRNVEALARATERGELASMSSFAAIHAQSKLAMARAFVHEPEEAREVFGETHALSAIDRAALLRDRATWVVKRDLSRVGDHVYVGALETDASFTEVLDDVAEAERELGDVWVAQRYVEPALLPTPWGPRCLTLGAYVLDGRFVGYLARLSKVSLCSHDALVLPVFVDDGRPGRLSA